MEVDDSAHGGQRPDDRTVERDAAEGAASEDGDETDRGHRHCKTDAEGDDQQQPIADPLQRDRGEQDDERGRAGNDPGGDPDAEQPGAATAFVLVCVRVVMVVRVVMTVGVGVRGAGA